VGTALAIGESARRATTDFNIVHEHQTSRLGGQTDGTGIFIDNDPNATGRAIFAALVTDPGTSGQLVSTERLEQDYLSSSK